MRKVTVAFFGEAERGEFRTGYFCQNLSQLSDNLGEPPSSDAVGLQLAVKALLYDFPVIFFRVHEEGYGPDDYYTGFQILQKKEGIPKIAALGIPGVGDTQIIAASDIVCNHHNSFLIFTEKDLYDYLTN